MIVKCVSGKKGITPETALRLAKYVNMAPLFSKKAYAYIGPSNEVFIYSNRQNIAVYGFDYAQSYAGLFSLGLYGVLIYPLSNNLNIETSLNFDALSLAFRMVDLEETDESPVKLLTLFSGTNSVYKLGIRYYLSNKLSVKVSYLFAATRISSWEPLYAASDNLIFTLTYGL